jgi:hypothetical protein
MRARIPPIRAGLSQIDFEQAALNRHDLAGRCGQSIKHFAPQFGRDAIRKSTIEGQKNKSAGIKSRVGRSGSPPVITSVVLLRALSGNPVGTAASVA